VDDAERLMARVRERDVAAFEALYDAHHRLVHGIGLRMLGDTMAADDLTQNVFLKVWHQPDVFGGGNFGGWISRVARNRALDVIRSRNLHPEGELPLDVPVEGALDESVIAQLDGERVRAAMQSLPSEQREVIELGFFTGITHEEIARRTQTPLGTVKTRIRSGLRKLRDALEGSVVS
jgi:RNA polymerase sigma-70 factor (ECF subfamily)